MADVEAAINVSWSGNSRRRRIKSSSFALGERPEKCAEPKRHQCAGSSASTAAALHFSVTVLACLAASLLLAGDGQFNWGR